MLLSILFLCITAWYLFKTPYTAIYKQSIYAFALMVIYLFVYLNTPYVQGEEETVNRYVYLFTFYPPMAYYMILFPQSVLLPLHHFFPNLPEYLAERAMVVLAYMGLIFLLLVLLGVKLFS